MTVFSRTKYEDNKGVVHPMRLSEATAAKAGRVPVGPITSRVPVKVTKGVREFGIKPRGLWLRRVVGTGSTASVQYKFLPLRTPSSFNTYPWILEEPLEIDGTTWYATSYEEESYG